MATVKLTALLKLGTGLRYLIDVKGGMKFGDKHILENCRAVIKLIPELGFVQTASAAPYRQLRELCTEFEKTAANRLTISGEEAKKLEEIARRVRDGLYTEAEDRQIYLGGGPLAYQVVLTIATVALLTLLAVLAGIYVDSLDRLQPWLIAATVLVMAVTGIWSTRGLRAPSLWLGFLALIASIIYAATGNGG